MNESIFLPLERVGLVRGSNLRVSALSQRPLTQILAALEEFIELTIPRQQHPQPDPFAYAASLSLSGAPMPCSEIECRLRKASELANFAALYADCIYVDSLISAHRGSVAGHQNEDKLRGRIRDDLTILLYLRPLIDAGLIVPVSLPRCPHCLSYATILPSRLRRAFKRQFKTLSTRYLRELSVVADCFGDELLLGLKGPEELIEHGGGGRLYDSIPNPIKKMPRLMRQLEMGESVLLSLAARQRLGLHQENARDELQNVQFELVTSGLFDVNLLTDRELHITVLNGLAAGSVEVTRNALMAKYLTAMVPFLAQVKPITLLRLRQAELDAFLVFRQSFAAAIREFASQRGPLTPNTARQLHADVIAPELARLDRQVTTARRTVLRQTAAKALGWTGAISAGVYAGILPEGLAAIAGAIGATNLVADLISSALAGSATPDEVSKSPFYFLWAVRRRAR